MVNKFGIKKHELFLGITILIIGGYLTFASPDFMTLGNIYDLINNYAMLTILACGLFIVLISGGIDISFPAMTIISQYVMVTLIQNTTGNFALAFALSGGIGLLLGVVNAILVNRLSVPSIIITISTLNIFYGLLLYLTKGVWLYSYPEWFEQGVMLFKFTAADGYDYGLSLQILTLIVVVALTGIIMNKTSIGRMIYAMGGNREAASRMGFGIFKLQLFVYGYMGLMSGVAGVVQSATVLTVAPDSLLGYELTVLAAVVLGGTSIIGGRGTLLGTLLGVILLAVLQNGLNLLGISSYWHTVVTGLVIVISISTTAWGQRKTQGVAL
ncbi:MULTISPECIES: ABC transporter permease [Enterobacteriaceae]|jgi:simple sugar transport system permease protein|uniref:ABC transporter permease n=2 Tax=Atlantibacter subterraneus TaxID=255519 RepID=A0A3R9G0N2_9ENTR|nr:MULTISPECIES: ABC transporter permease [Enterobacteriaceae]MDZ5664527.1 ABC transporter permease [Atlantibacter hermannii]QFH71978.1 ABC transporter permease [Enterobacter sp. E76]MDA3131633.1 ABC transporter permease [Atlantibacter subterranea]MDV7021375.1 ABC transporter permease [Atlantibacter subterranea]MDW2741273.1 ABC transporter permease [Atlantibacter subterranea]